VTESRFSGRPSRAPSEKSDKRERILRAAVKVFARKGFYASRVSEIAKAAGVADGTIYLYFKSKDELLTSLFEDRITRLLDVLRREVAAVPSGPGRVRRLLDILRREIAKMPTAPDRVRRLIELQLGLLEGERDLAEVITVNLRQSSRLLKQYATTRFTEYLDLMASVVAEGQRAGEIREDVAPRIMARALVGALDGIAMTWALGNAEPGGLKRAASQLADVLIAGLVVGARGALLTSEGERLDSPAARS
jgi:TetR/AcrR family fatty acid metabolism transcriptional regulator